MCVNMSASGKERNNTRKIKCDQSQFEHVILIVGVAQIEILKTLYYKFLFQLKGKFSLLNNDFKMYADLVVFNKKEFK